MSWFLSCCVLVLCLSCLSSGHRHSSRGGFHRLRSLFYPACTMPKDEGPCRAVILRFYFNAETNLCEGFEYGGCHGNANNFETLEKCEDICVTMRNVNLCLLEEDPGPCRGLFQRYFFNNQTQACEAFFYGGCYGNANNFISKEECRARCLRQSCFQPVQKGSCSESLKRFAYSPASRRCQSFRYSGCEGNDNNFTTKKDCTIHCMRSVPDHLEGKRSHGHRHITHKYV